MAIGGGSGHGGLPPDAMHSGPARRRSLASCETTRSLRLLRLPLSEKSSSPLASPIAVNRFAQCLSSMVSGQPLCTMLVSSMVSNQPLCTMLVSSMVSGQPLCTMLVSSIVSGRPLLTHLVPDAIASLLQPSAATCPSCDLAPGPLPWLRLVPSCPGTRTTARIVLIGGSSDALAKMSARSRAGGRLIVFPTAALTTPSRSSDST